MTTASPAASSGLFHSSITPGPEPMRTGATGTAVAATRHPVPTARRICPGCEQRLTPRARARVWDDVGFSRQAPAPYVPTRRRPPRRLEAEGNEEAAYWPRLPARGVSSDRPSYTCTVRPSEVPNRASLRPSCPTRRHEFRNAVVGHSRGREQWRQTGFQARRIRLTRRHSQA